MLQSSVVSNGHHTRAVDDPAAGDLDLLGGFVVSSVADINGVYSHDLGGEPTARNVDISTLLGWLGRLAVVRPQHTVSPNEAKEPLSLH